MKIIGFRAENVKRISVVELAPEGHVIELTGKNRQGKTSILDAIWWAMEGTTHIQAEPIRAGQDKAVIRLDLGGEELKYRVTRKFSRRTEPKAGEPGYTSTITVETPEGARFSSPQKTLDSLIGALAFDPLAFLRMDPAKQFEALRSFVPGFDFDANSKAHKAAFAERTEANRAVKDAQSRLSAIVLPADAPTEAVDESKLVDRLEQAGRHNAEIERVKADRARAVEGVASVRRAAEQYREQSAKIEEQIKALQVQQQDLQRLAADRDTAADQREAELAALKALPDPIDTAEVRREIDEARRTNEVVARVKARAAAQERVTAALAEVTAIEERLESTKAERAAAISKAKMPVAGLGFGDGEVVFNDLPLNQASDAEQWSVGIAIAAAMNPKLRVIRVRDGSLLDKEAMQILAAFAAEHDLQVWVETVESDRPGAIVIENGHVQGQEPRPEAEAAETPEADAAPTGSLL